MIARFSSALLIIAAMALPMALIGCETHHEESTKQNMFGGTTHQETTTTRNPITGDVSTESSKQVTH